ncbi:hypothetical protein RRG08_018972 [Elysia crispata]|uniref:Uncharacterized protein n=1 Tax=Elysia crispata TaxID=231223 RepID=A0AAE1A6G7_9GAST|nr:hypothetical protein RRG08_018972 [Elysia crispata]
MPIDLSRSYILNLDSRFIEKEKPTTSITDPRRRALDRNSIKTRPRDIEIICKLYKRPRLGKTARWRRPRLPVATHAARDSAPKSHLTRANESMISML